MNDKQIMIDGKECRYWFRPNPSDYRKCSLRGKNDTCDEITDCFIKELLGKLALKEQENEEFKKELEVIYDDCKGCPTCNEALYNANLYAKEYRKLKQTFNRIKGIAEENIRIADLEGLNGVYRRGLAEQILQKINEVELNGYNP